MKFQAEIDVMPLKALLDPQGKAVTSGLKNMGFNQVEDVRIGKHISLTLSASSEEEARNKVEEACKNLLVNHVMESFTYTLEVLSASEA